jgi:hypothetical protein
VAGRHIEKVTLVREPAEGRSICAAMQGKYN